jgi:hypothetical protein
LRKSGFPEVREFFRFVLYPCEGFSSVREAFFREDLMKLSRRWRRGPSRPEHLTRHLVTMSELHQAGRYDRLGDGVERVTGRPAMSVREFVLLYADEFGGRRS